MNSSTPLSKLAELAAPTRGRVKYAPLTAGLLARKGEALPATPYFAAEALDLYTSGPIVVARHEPTPMHPHERAAAAAVQARRPADEASALSVRPAASWRLRRPLHAVEHVEAEIEKPEAHIHDVAVEAHAPAVAAEPKKADTQRVAISVELDLEVLARLALHAQHSTKSPSQVIEEALKGQALPDDSCPSCARPHIRPKS